MERHILRELKMLKNMGANAKMNYRKNLNFSEYQFKGNYNRCFALPNFSYGKTTLNNNIKRNKGICSKAMRN